MTLTPIKIYEDDEYMILKIVYQNGVSEVFVFNKENGTYISIDSIGNTSD